ncbi:MAG: hypothetical protein IJ970_01450, partial [Mycoplasmataceae bacterium]|nr:hypothetical protein [Mycoplasmataceae bacterium]
YKIKASEIQIDENSISLVNVGQAESAPYALDGYARLKHLSLVEDESKNYLGAAIKINYFNDFYKDQTGKILTSGSGQVLVKREDGTSSKEYKDKDGNPIKDVNNTTNILLQLNENGIPTNPIKTTSTTNHLDLSQYSLNAFKFPDLDKTELKYNFFQNQTIEFEFVNKKGQAPENEYDYYVDQQGVKVEYTFNNIKFPISNEQNISYEFNAQEFVEKISNPINRDDVYKNALDPNEPPINGQSKLVETFKVIRRENNQKETTLTTLEEINKQIKTDFSGQVKLVATYTSTDGQIKQIDGGDIFSIETLKNGDRFKIEIVSSSDELIFAQLPNPLIFVVSGLFEKDIEQELLKHLRVKQGGVIDGQGSFNILVDDPNQSNSNSDLKTSLGGYKFLVRVWNENKQIKHEWTENFISINDLNNGDKVEWKLVSPNGSPVKEAYYNTIANPTKHNAAEDKYSFIKVNQEGFAGKNISEPQEGIGQNPEQLNAYPEDSGLLISGLKSRDDSSYTTIDDSEFRRVMNLMNFSYAGINGSGNMISSTSASDIKLNVLGRSSDEFTLDYLIKNGYVTFYYNNESSSQMNSFNWNQVKDENGNWLTSPGTLSNGDSVAIRYKDPISEYWYYAPVVSGLQNKSDGMSMLSWVGIGAAAFVTLGIFVFIYLYVRNKKLK